MCMQIGRQLFEMFGNMKLYFSENFHVWDFEMLIVFKAMRLHVNCKWH